MVRRVWSRNLKNEEAMTRVGSQRHSKKKKKTESVATFARHQCAAKEIQPAWVVVLNIQYVFDASEWVYVAAVAWIYPEWRFDAPEGASVLHFQNHSDLRKNIA